MSNDKKKDPRKGWITELHRLNPDQKEWPNSHDYVGIVDGKLRVKVFPLNKAGKEEPRTKEFSEYWLPPEMNGKRMLRFNTFVTFDKEGEIVALGYPLYDYLSWEKQLLVMPIAGDKQERYQEVVQVSMVIRDVLPVSNCVLTFPVVERNGEKLFALPGGYFTDAIPALDEFQETNYLYGLPGTKDRWKSSNPNIDVIRGGKVIAKGEFGTVGTHGSYTVVYLHGFAPGNNSTRIPSKNFEVGDKLRISLAHYGAYPIVENLFRMAQIDGMDHSMFEIGKPYSFDEFAKLSQQSAQKAGEQILPDVLETKVIRLARKE